MKPKYDISLLAKYQSAAIKNATSLIAEANLLLKNEFYARAYFLSVAAVEETGKAAIAFNGQGRNLAAQNVQSRLDVDFRDHRVKIVAAFFACLQELSPQKLRERFKTSIDLAVALKDGRESSMYSDIRDDLAVHEPMHAVRKENAIDCVRLADDCLKATILTLKTTPIRRFSQLEDKLYTLGSKTTKVWKEENFGDYLLNILEAKEFNGEILAKAITTYHNEYLSKGKKFEAR